MSNISRTVGSRLSRSSLVGIYFLPFILIFKTAVGAYGQTVVDSFRLDSIWTELEPHINDNGPDQVYEWIETQLNRADWQAYPVRSWAYQQLINRLEQSYHLPEAIYLVEALVRRAERSNDLLTTANSYFQLFRFHDALGNQQLATVNLDRSLAIQQQIDDPRRTINIEALQLERSLNAENWREVLRKMKRLRQRADSLQFPRGQIDLELRMKRIGLLFDEDSIALSHIRALEQIEVPKSDRAAWFTIRIQAAMSRATIAKARGRLDTAQYYFQQTLRYCREQPNRWLETKTLQDLADLALQRFNFQLAGNLLDTARNIAEERNLLDLLATNYSLSALVAEAQGRFATALSYTRLAADYKSRFTDRSAGFDIENYYLRLEKEQLAAEKENQELELRLKNLQVRNSLLLAAAAILVLLLMAIGFWNQRRQRLQLQQQNTLIEAQRTRLSELDKAKSRFFANISHELRTPLTLLSGPVRTLLKQAALADRERELLRMVDQNARHLQSMVTDILHLNKLEVGKLQLELEPTDVPVFFRQLIDPFARAASEHQLNWDQYLDLPPAYLAEIDRSKSRQIIYNLLSNAFKFTPAGGQVVLRMRITNGYLHASVQDTGPGIHPGDVPYLFDRYFQTNHSEQPAQGGMGIGLALCKEYVELFDGVIEVDSRLGEGSTFRICFPLQRCNDQQGAVHLPNWSEAPVNPSEVRTHDPKNTSLLVVEDQADLRSYLQLILSDRYQVITATNGAEALTCLNRHPEIRLVLSDLMMPVMDGYQLLDQLKASDASRHLPVIVLTARAGKDNKLRALRIGVDDYLTKPFDEEELICRIDNLLVRTQARLSESRLREGPVGESFISQEDQQWLTDLEAFVGEHLTEDTLSVATLADQFAMSDSTLLRQVKRLTGVTPAEYLREMRLAAARELLEAHTYNSVARIATEVGYRNAHSFSRSFKKRYGKAPSDYL